MTLCGLVGGAQCFRSMCGLHLQPGSEMETVCPSERLVFIYHTIWCDNMAYMVYSVTGVDKKYMKIR
jgi:hypothetical protein